MIFSYLVISSLITIVFIQIVEKLIVNRLLSSSVRQNVDRISIEYRMRLQRILFIFDSSSIFKIRYFVRSPSYVFTIVQLVGIDVWLRVNRNIPDDRRVIVFLQLIEFNVEQVEQFAAFNDCVCVIALLSRCQLEYESKCIL